MFKISREQKNQKKKPQRGNLRRRAEARASSVGHQRVRNCWVMSAINSGPEAWPTPPRRREAFEDGPRPEEQVQRKEKDVGDGEMVGGVVEERLSGEKFGDKISMFDNGNTDPALLMAMGIVKGGDDKDGDGGDGGGGGAEVEEVRGREGAKESVEMGLDGKEESTEVKDVVDNSGGLDTPDIPVDVKVDNGPSINSENSVSPTLESVSVDGGRKDEEKPKLATPILNTSSDTPDESDQVVPILDSAPCVADVTPTRNDEEKTTRAVEDALSTNVVEEPNEPKRLAEVEPTLGTDAEVATWRGKSPEDIPPRNVSDSVDSANFATTPMMSDSNEVNEEIIVLPKSPEASKEELKTSTPPSSGPVVEIPSSASPVRLQDTGKNLESDSPKLTLVGGGNAGSRSEIGTENIIPSTDAGVGKELHARSTGSSSAQESEAPAEAESTSPKIRSSVLEEESNMDKSTMGEQGSKDTVGELDNGTQQKLKDTAANEAAQDMNSRSQATISPIVVNTSAPITFGDKGNENLKVECPLATHKSLPGAKEATKTSRIADRDGPKSEEADEITPAGERKPLLGRHRDVGGAGKTRSPVDNVGSAVTPLSNGLVSWLWEFLIALFDYILSLFRGNSGVQTLTSPTSEREDDALLPSKRSAEQTLGRYKQSPKLGNTSDGTDAAPREAASSDKPSDAQKDKLGQLSSLTSKTTESGDVVSRGSGENVVLPFAGSRRGKPARDFLEVDNLEADDKTTKDGTDSEQNKDALGTEKSDARESETNETDTNRTPDAKGDSPREREETVKVRDEALANIEESAVNGPVFPASEKVLDDVAEDGILPVIDNDRKEAGDLKSLGERISVSSAGKPQTNIPQELLGHGSEAPMYLPDPSTGRDDVLLDSARYNAHGGLSGYVGVEQPPFPKIDEDDEKPSTGVSGETSETTTPNAPYVSGETAKEGKSGEEGIRKIDELPSGGIGMDDIERPSESNLRRLRSFSPMKAKMQSWKAKSKQEVAGVKQSMRKMLAERGLGKAGIDDDNSAAFKTTIAPSETFRQLQKVLMSMGCAMDFNERSTQRKMKCKTTMEGDRELLVLVRCDSLGNGGSIVRFMKPKLGSLRARANDYTEFCRRVHEKFLIASEMPEVPEEPERSHFAKEVFLRSNSTV